MGLPADEKTSPIRKDVPVPLPPQAAAGGTEKTRTTAHEGAPAAARPPAGRRLYVIDGLRLIAALMVVSYHYVGYNVNDFWGKKNATVFPTIHGPASYGWLGVYLFFLISGFVICMSSWNRTPRQFITSRFTRLYPAYWVGIALTSIVLYTVPQPIKHLDAGRILTNLSMLQRGLGVKDVDGVYWTLWAELRFYMLFAIVIAMGVTYRRVMAFCVIWTAAAIFAEYGDSDLLATLVEPRYAPFFIGGIGIYLMHRFGPRPEIWLLIAMSWLLGQHKMITFAHAAQEHSRSRVSWAVCACLLALFYAVLIAVARGRLGFLNWRWLTVAGALTYPLYLIHEDIGFTVIKHLHDDMPPHLLLGLLVPAMLLTALLVNRLIEEPTARRLKKWLARPRPARPAGRTEAAAVTGAGGGRPRWPSR